MAFGSGTIQAFGGAVNDLFSSQAAAKGLRLKAYGNRIEGQEYDMAAGLSDLNEEFSRQSTAIKLAQSERQTMLGIGHTQSDIAAAGFTGSGTALDLLRSSAQQGALTHQVVSQQGLISEAGYKEQGASYRLMADAARYAAGEEDKLAHDATVAGQWSAGFKIASGVASMFTGGIGGGGGETEDPIASTGGVRWIGS